MADVCILFDVCSEKGEFLALDLGGSKFKVLQVKVSENGKRKVHMESETYPIPKEVFNGRSTEVRTPPNPPNIHTHIHTYS